MLSTYIRIKTENDKKYEIKYAARIKDTGKWFEHSNKGNNSPINNRNYIRIDAFYAKLDFDEGHYDICYTAFSLNHGWTSIACDGDEINLEDVGGEYFSYIIIYVTEEQYQDTPRIYNDIY